MPAGRPPPFFASVIADALVTSVHRGSPVRNPTRARGLLAAIRLCWSADTFAAQVAYRLQARLRGLHVPLVPAILRRVAVWVAGFKIAEEVHVAPGLHVAHGLIEVEGETRIEGGVSIFPFATIGPRAGESRGPTLRAGASIGTGAKVVGPVVVGEHAWVGANAVVFTDTPDHGSATGVPTDGEIQAEPQPS